MAYLESKPRYEVLDGLRGVAALCVVGFHMMECYSADITNNIMAHGYLAVDFFFALSGFVIGYAYDDRWGKMTTWGFFTLDLTLGWDVLGMLPAPQYTVIGGWSLTPDQIYIALTRLFYPFLTGLMISRMLAGRISSENASGSPIHLKGGFWWASLLLIVIFSVPCIGGYAGLANGIYQAIIILLVFPLILLIGAGSRTTDTTSTRICNFLGDISYPLYITHYPLMYMHMSFHANHPDVPLFVDVMMSAGVVIFAVIMAYVLLKVYDIPVRQWLVEKGLNNRQSNP